jgi:hypothetical protein
MIIRYLKSLFRPRRFDAGRRPVHRIWLGDQEDSTLIDLGSGKVLARIWHDGYAKYYPSIYVSPLQAVRLTLGHQAWLVSLLPFPRCIMDLYRFRTMEDAQGCVEHILAGGS